MGFAVPVQYSTLLLCVPWSDCWEEMLGIDGFGMRASLSLCTAPAALQYDECARNRV